MCFSALITFAQYLYKCSYEEIAKQVKDVMDLAHKCVANEQDPECLKPVVGKESIVIVILLCLHCKYSIMIKHSVAIFNSEPKSLIGISSQNFKTLRF